MKTTLNALAAVFAIQLGIMLVGAPPASAAGVSPATGITKQLNTPSSDIQQVHYRHDRYPHWRYRHHHDFGYYRPHRRCHMERVRVWTEYGPRKVWVKRCYRGW